MGAFTYEIVDNCIAVVTFNNPPVNALGLQEKKDSIEIFKELEANENLGAIILRGSGRGFSAGSNVKEFDQYTDESLRAYQEVDKEFLHLIQFSKVPLICATHGFAIAMGCAVASSADVIISTPDCLFGMPEIKVGMIGGEECLARLMPDKLAHYLALTGNYVKAEDIFQYGQILKLTDEENLLEESLKVAREITKNYVRSVRFVKDCITRRIFTKENQELQEVMNEYSRVISLDSERAKMLSNFGKHPKE